MDRYKLCHAEIVDGIVELPEGATPLQVGLMLTGSMSDPDTVMRDGIKYLVKIENKEAAK